MLSRELYMKTWFLISKSYSNCLRGMKENGVALVSIFYGPTELHRQLQVTLERFPVLVPCPDIHILGIRIPFAFPAEGC